jgi:hypothetical protein
VNILTWDLDGAGAGWADHLDDLLEREQPHAVCLQSVPAGEWRTAPVRSVDGIDISCLELGPSARHRRWFVTSGVDGLAVVTPTDPGTHVRTVAPDMPLAAGNDLLGVFVAGWWCLSAKPFERPRAVSLLRAAIASLAPPWLVAGGFHSEPGALGAPTGLRLVTCGPTYDTRDPSLTRAYDYIVGTGMPGSCRPAASTPSPHLPVTAVMT